MAKDPPGQYESESRALKSNAAGSHLRIISERCAMLLHNAAGKGITGLSFVQQQGRQAIEAPRAAFCAVGKEIEHLFNRVQVKKVEYAPGERRRRFDAEFRATYGIQRLLTQLIATLSLILPEAAMPYPPVRSSCTGRSARPAYYRDSGII